ncbi:MAG: TIM barrel protein [Eubacteriales bacterium]|nr:TIM barrel protein [Eubacteriales bacterium]
MGRFQYGVCEWSVRARGKELCKLAADLKLDCIQLGAGEEIFAGRGLGSGNMLEEYLAASEKYGVKIESLSPQFVDQYSFTMPKNISEEQIAVELVNKTIELCTVLGCHYFLLPILCKNDICDGQSFHKAVEYIKRFSDKAGGKGIETYLELNQNASQIHDLLDAVDDPAVKIFFDSQNLYAHNGTSMARHFSELAEFIGGIHLKDGAGSVLSGSLLGEGTSGFFKTAQAIINSDYSGSLIIENVYGKPTVCCMGSEKELLAKDVETLHRVFD